MTYEVSFQIPATSANLGLGFDSMGVALQKYLTIQAKKSDHWQFTYDQEALKVLPVDEKNLVAKTAIQVAEEYGQDMPALHVHMTSEIPLTHGLGSSSSAIVAGIELANYYGKLNLDEAAKIRSGTLIEGHPDNVGPCVTGGVFVGEFSDDQLTYYTMDLEGISLITSIPDYELSTAEARKALPDEYNRQVAVDQNAKNNVMLLAMLNKDYQAMGRLMMQDQFHEPYRGPLIPEFDDIKQIATGLGAYATVISGAGPTLLTLCPSQDQAKILQALEPLENCQHEAIEVHYN